MYERRKAIAPMNDSLDNLTCRNGETPLRRFRAPDRCFQSNGQWYFATREGIDVGPFRTRAAAEAAVARLTQHLRGVTDEVLVRRLIEAALPLADPWQGRAPR
jgi:hypothetical protein